MIQTFLRVQTQFILYSKSMLQSVYYIIYMYIFFSHSKRVYKYLCGQYGIFWCSICVWIFIQFIRALEIFIIWYLFDNISRYMGHYMAHFCKFYSSQILGDTQLCRTSDIRWYLTLQNLYMPTIHVLRLLLPRWRPPKLIVNDVELYRSPHISYSRWYSTLQDLKY